MNAKINVSAPSSASASASTALFDTRELLEHNDDLIAAIVENLQLGRLDSCTKYYAILQRNLVKLGSDVDAAVIQLKKGENLMLSQSNIANEAKDPGLALDLFGDYIYRRDILDEFIASSKRHVPVAPIPLACEECQVKGVDEFECRTTNGHTKLPYFLGPQEKGDIQGIASLAALRQLDPEVEHSVSALSKQRHSTSSGLSKGSLIMSKGRRNGSIPGSPNPTKNGNQSNTSTNLDPNTNHNMNPNMTLNPSMQHLVANQGIIMQGRLPFGHMPLQGMHGYNNNSSNNSNNNINNNNSSSNGNSQFNNVAFFHPMFPNARLHMTMNGSNQSNSNINNNSNNMQSLQSLQSLQPLQSLSSMFLVRPMHPQGLSDALAMSRAALPVQGQSGGPRGFATALPNKANEDQSSSSSSMLDASEGTTKKNDKDSEKGKDKTKGKGVKGGKEKVAAKEGRQTSKKMAKDNEDSNNNVNHSSNSNNVTSSNYATANNGININENYYYRGIGGKSISNVASIAVGDDDDVGHQGNGFDGPGDHYEYSGSYFHDDVDDGENNIIVVPSGLDGGRKRKQSATAPKEKPASAAKKPAKERAPKAPKAPKIPKPAKTPAADGKKGRGKGKGKGKKTMPSFADDSDDGDGLNKDDHDDDDDDTDNFAAKRSRKVNIFNNNTIGSILESPCASLLGFGNDSLLMNDDSLMFHGLINEASFMG